MNGPQWPERNQCWTGVFLAWLSDPKLNGAGALFDFGCYGADLATWLMDGRRPVSVTAGDAAKSSPGCVSAKWMMRRLSS